MPGQEAVFISYRRSDSAAQAGQLRDQLAGQLHPEAVFFDQDMRIGDDFPDEIGQAVARALAVLVVIGPGWLKAMQDRAAGAAKSDWVYEEIKAALERRTQGDKLLIVPLLLPGASMPEAGQLPVALGNLWRLNADALEAQTQVMPGTRGLFDRLLQAGVRRYMGGDDKAILLTLGKKVTALLEEPLMAGIAAKWKDRPDEPSPGTDIPKAITELGNAIRACSASQLKFEPREKAEVHGTCQRLLSLLCSMASDLALARQSRLSGGQLVAPAGQPGDAVNLIASELNALAGGAHVPVLLEPLDQQHPIYANVIDTGMAGIGSDATAHMQAAVWMSLQATLKRNYPEAPTRALAPDGDDFADLRDAVQVAKWAHRPVLLAHAHSSGAASPLPIRDDAARLKLDYLPYGPKDKDVPLTRWSMGLVNSARLDCQQAINNILAP